ncbi:MULTISPECIES: ATP-binding protein [Nocardiaceae]|uniref:histidine kinase n=1 Tax=Rhodococcoides corynebacterioides TaxID=53972 RepID=A0ABS2KY85_9NOCA|nr:MULTISPECIES: ATP-binding protein [Rhodococcus]MBM7416872.1 signal transduction histidine kinase [Rhodococcus corynebacterioides]MBP1115125.1 signal transduction histidine kinase [Rhodococcus sp. PvP016]
MTTPPRRGLRTGSLRLRLLVSVMSVVLVLLVGIVVATTVLLQRQLEASAGDSLAGRTATAQQLLDNGADPTEIVSATQGENVAAQLVTTDGRVVGDLALRATTPPPALRPPTTPGDGPPPGPPPGPEETRPTRVSTTTLTDGSVLTVAVDTSSIDAVQRQLLVVLIPLVLVASAVAALLMAVVVGASLRPLRSMTALARSITRGNRGDRLAPTRSDTELGKTATAFDEMLDELEGAEARERATADRTRQFVDDAAHDLRTPVAGISAAAETLLRGGVDTEREVRERLLASMIRESRRASRLIDDLLMSARTDDDVELDRSDHDLLALARADADRARLLAPDSTVVVTGESVVAPVDAARIARILANLSDNALRHGPPEGVVTVDVRDAGATATIRVSDEGPGIGTRDRERIFDRMVRLDSARTSEGSGLGLTIARTYARAHGGDVVYDGTAFVLTVPR